ncbi:uncharacterized protein [Aquarana catesbeiana]|uniref:uncharacterized protein isoform X2 n=1 Tax=Aquarana catesbeiana TaxID=8400 RepID=UPI003CC9773C
MSAVAKFGNETSQDVCTSDQGPEMEFCEIDLSNKKDVFLNLRGKVQVAVNGSVVVRRTPLFHEDEIQLGKSNPLYVLNLPNHRRTGALQNPPNDSTHYKHRATGQSEEASMEGSQDQKVIFLSRAGLDLNRTANQNNMSLYFNIPETLSKVGLIQGGGVTFQQKMAASRQENGEKLGVFFWDSDTDINWITHEVADRMISSMFCLALSWVGDQFWRSVASRCTMIIFCHSMKSGKSLYDLNMYLDHLLQSHGAENIIMVIGDLEDLMCEKGMRAQWRQSPFSAIELILFSEMEMNLLCPLRLRQLIETGLVEAKLSQIRCILLQLISEMNSTSRHIFKSHKKHVIGIFSKSANNCFSWLKTILSSAENFRDLVKEVLQFQLVAIDKKLTRMIFKCTLAILYHTKEQGSAKITDVSGSIYNEELQCLSTILGRDNVIVVLDDMDKSRSAEKMRILKEQPSIDRLARDLFLFGVKEKSEHVTYKTSKDYIEGERMQQKIKPLNDRIKIRENNVESRAQDLTANPNTMQKHLTRVDLPESDNTELMLDALTFPGTQKKQMSEKQVVGIFSRSPQRDYYWLQDLLKSGALQSYVQEVKYGYILECDWRPFRRVVSECTFGVLYHSKRNGRAFITDVPGSLYDSHLNHLSARLGKKNVLVVIDDMEDPSAEEKARILEKQPSLRKLTGGVLLFGRDKTYTLNNSIEKRATTDILN